MNSTRTFLTKDELEKKAPAIFSTSPVSGVSKNYTFIPTFEIIDGFEKIGWKPVAASQQKSKIHSPMHTPHVVRLAKTERNEVSVGDLIPEIVIFNAHNRVMKLMIQLGIFKLVCSNGLVISDTNFLNISNKHVNVEFAYIQQIAYESVKKFDEVFNKIEDYKTIELTEVEKNKFAMKAIESNWGQSSIIKPEYVLTPRRVEDEKNDLFSVFNVIQENITKGGISYSHPNSTGKLRRRKTKQIKNINRDLFVNENLWMIMEAFRATRTF